MEQISTVEKFVDFFQKHPRKIYEILNKVEWLVQIDVDPWKNPHDFNPKLTKWAPYDIAIAIVLERAK